MATTYNAAPHQAQYNPHRSQQPSFHVPAVPAPVIPPGTFQPGTVIRVGSHKCTIDRYLSEGGFAHVYLVKLTQVVDGTDVAVLKRVAVPDKEALASMRVEVETMKRLKGHRHIVTYIDSHASQLKGGGYEVFLLMEFCSGGGLIDFMNTRLQNRLNESEVLKIFNDVAEGVACMHYLQPPLLHRDLKIENILITPTPRRYKLCDFGSCSEVKPAGKSTTECRLIEEDIQKHTTLQYRSPEMVDVFKGLPIDEKSDIWALGVLLYKLCYYTTPFEDRGPLAILNATFKFPPYPAFSDQLRRLISSMLREDPRLRPNIYQIVREVCRQRGTECPIQDIYSNKRTSSKTASTTPIAPPPVQAPTVAALIREKPPPPQKVEIPQIQQMRRGRPTKASESAPAPTASLSRPSKSPSTIQTSNDPFAALDKQAPSDELSNRFPSVEQFSLLHDSGTKFDFGASITSPIEVPKKDLNTRVMERLADNAFTGMPAPPTLVDPSPPALVDSMESASMAESKPRRSFTQETSHPRPIMVSQGTMTTPSMNTPSPTPPPRLSSSGKRQSYIEYNDNPVDEPTFRPPARGSSNANRRSYIEYHDTPVDDSSSRLHPSSVPDQRNLIRPNLLDRAASSYTSVSSINESDSRPASVLGSRTSRVSSTGSRPRPPSTHIESNLEFLRDLDSTSKPVNPRYSQASPMIIQSSATGQSTSSVQSDHIESNVDFLRALQSESDSSKTKADSKRVVSVGNAPPKHNKRASITAINLSNTKNLLAGRFGDAFRKFELSGPDGKRRSPSPDTRNAPVFDMDDDINQTLEISMTEIPAEMKREMEKRQLADEERRVTEAAAEYRRNLADKEAGRPVARARAGSIQRKVQALLDDENRSPVVRVAEGYGKYTDAELERAAAAEPDQGLSRSRTVAQANPRQYPIASLRMKPDLIGRVIERPGSAMGPMGPMSISLTNEPPRPQSTRPRNLAIDHQYMQASPLSPQRRPGSSGRSRPQPAPKPDKFRHHHHHQSIPSASEPYATRGLPQHQQRLPPQIQAYNNVIGTDILTSPLAEQGPYQVVGDDLNKFKQRFPSLSGLEFDDAGMGNGRSR